MSVKSAQAVTVLFTTQNPTTGAAADATGTPTGTLYVNGTANGATVTVTNITTGVYKAALTLPSLTAGDVVSLRIAATVASVAGEAVVWQDTTTAIVADEVWDEAAAGHATAGTFGQIVSGTATLVTSISSAMTTLTNRVGAWTGTGVNTVLGAFKAALSKTATLPTDIGGTFDPAADSTEAISEAVAAVKVDTAAILEDTGTTLPGLFAASGATVTVISAVNGGTITVYVADTWSFTVTDATLDLSDYEAVALSVKRNARQADAEALLYLRSDTGLQRIGGAAPGSADNGTLSKTSTSFTALVALAETGGLTAGQYTWWLKGFDTTPAPDTGFTLATGAFVLERAGLAAVS